MTSRLDGWRRWLDLLLTFVLLAAGTTVLWNAHSRRSPASSREIPIPTEPQTIVNAELRGSATAPVVLIIFSDFQCPYCGSFARDVLPQIDKSYVESGKLAIAFRHYPLEQIHPAAFGAAAVATCSGTHFWETHDIFFANQGALGGADEAKVAALAGVDWGRIRACVAQEGRERVRADLAMGQRLQLRSTPVFLLGLRGPHGVRVTRTITGTRPAPEFLKLIDSVVSSRSHG